MKAEGDKKIAEVKKKLEELAGRGGLHTPGVFRKRQMQDLFVQE
jgi:hypothetical protein